MADESVAVEPAFLIKVLSLLHLVNNDVVKLQ
jgi:hypothetical protein